MKRITHLLTFGFVLLSFQTPTVKAPSLKVLSNGNVGINTVQPAYRLDVNSMESRSYYPGKMALHINHHGYDPRLCSSDRIVFFKNDESGHARIEFLAGLQAADRETMENIVSLENKGIATVSKLQGFSFTYKNDQLKRNEYGFIAQNVETVLPEAVYFNDSTNGKLLSYNSILPFLVEANKELLLKMEELTFKLETLEDLLKKSNILTTAQPNLKNSHFSTKSARLEQNVPNPFGSETRVNCFIPDSGKICLFNIFNAQGVLLQVFQIEGKGIQEVKINGKALPDGIYVYQLNVDGKIVDSKKMIKDNSLVNTGKYEGAHIYPDFTSSGIGFFANRTTYLQN